MTSLNDTQTILLSHASQREGGSLLPVPACIRTPGHTVRRLLAELLDQGLAEERPVRDATLLWRENGDDRFGLFATEAGLAALDGGGAGGEADRNAAAMKVQPVVPAEPEAPTTRPDSKQTKLLTMLQSETGASIEQLCTSFGWQAHSARAMLTGLRIRDKIAQSKARGIWMGGPVPLGYEVRERKLIPLPDEAETVRRIFSLYLELPSVRALKERLDAEGIVTKVQNGKNGTTGGVPFARGAIYHLLANPIYIGKLRHKEKVHEGEHDGIVPIDLWQAVQQRLAQRGPEMRMRRSTADGPALLTGMVHDHINRPLSPTHVKKAASAIIITPHRSRMTSAPAPTVRRRSCGSAPSISTWRCAMPSSACSAPMRFID